MSNLGTRIARLERLIGRLPALTREHVGAVEDFLRTGCPARLVSGITRAETLAVINAIEDGDADALPGLVKIGRALGEVRTRYLNLAPLGVLDELRVMDFQDDAIIRLGPDHAATPRETEFTPGALLLAQLGLFRLFQVAPDPNAPTPAQRRAEEEARNKRRGSFEAPGQN